MSMDPHLLEPFDHHLFNRAVREWRIRLRALVKATMGGIITDIVDQWFQPGSAEPKGSVIASHGFHR